MEQHPVQCRACWAPRAVQRLCLHAFVISFHCFPSADDADLTLSASASAVKHVYHSRRYADVKLELTRPLVIIYLS